MPVRNNEEQEKYEKKCKLLAIARLAKAQKILMKKDEVVEEPVKEEPVKKPRKSRAKIQSEITEISEMPEPEKLHEEPEIEAKVEVPEPDIEIKIKKPRAKKEEGKKLELDLSDKPTEPVVEEVVEIRKIKRPTKLIKKVIQEVYESDSTEGDVIEEIVVAPKQKVKKEKKTEVLEQNNIFGFSQPQKSNQPFTFRF